MNLENSNLIQKDHVLADYSSWRVGGLAEYFSAPKDIEQLQAVLTWARERKAPVTLFSGGTNVLFSDQGIEGLTIGLACINGTEAEERDGFLYIRSMAGSSKGEILKWFLKYELDPALFIAGLPGDIGGGVVMNAGVSSTHPAPREFCEIVDWVEVLRWQNENQEYKIFRIAAKEIQWSYRKSEGWQPGVIVQVGFKWPLKPNPNIKRQVREAMKRRMQTQPLNQPNCGSVFRNPEGFSAGALIEQSGLKGYTVGGAMVSEKHANFIVNVNQAKASDINQIIQHVKKTVQDRWGIELHTEVIHLGKW